MNHPSYPLPIISRTFTEVSITADEQLRERLIGILTQLGFEGFWEDGAVLRCYIGSERWSDNMTEEVKRVVSLVQRSSGSPGPSISLRTVENKNWNEQWERTIRPIHVTKRIVVAPTWHAYEPQPNELLIRIDPKMSFGTGYHESTRLVLHLMEEHVKPEMRILDLGTGTGILAIAGVKLGAALAIGVDTDEWAYQNALENARLNHVENQVQVLLGDLSSVPAGRFDMIVANIQRSVIESLLPDMKSRLHTDGIIILSGLLRQDEESIKDAMTRCRLRMVRTMSENEWIALAVQSSI